MRLSLILTILFAFNSLFAQVLLPDTLLKQNCGIILTDKVILDVQVWSVSDSKIEYYDGKSLHDLNRNDIKRFDFKDYSAIIKENTLYKIKVYDLLVVSNTYQGIKEVNENNKIFFSKKNNSTVKSYPSFTEFVNGYDIYNADKQSQAITSTVVNENSTSKDSVKTTFKTDSINAAQQITLNDSLKKSESIVEQNQVVNSVQTTTQSSDQINNTSLIDPVTSYKMGRDAAVKRFDAAGYTALSCAASGCGLGLGSALLLIKPDKMKPGVLPKNVNKEMFEEGYYNKVHEMRRRSYVKGTLIFIGTITAVYVATYAVIFLALI